MLPIFSLNFFFFYFFPNCTETPECKYPDVPPTQRCQWRWVQFSSFTLHDSVELLTTNETAKETFSPDDSSTWELNLQAGELSHRNGLSLRWTLEFLLAFGFQARPPLMSFSHGPEILLFFSCDTWCQCFFTQEMVIQFPVTLDIRILDYSMDYFSTNALHEHNPGHWQLLGLLFLYVYNVILYYI